MAEEIYIDEFDLTPEPTKLKQDRAKLPEEKELPKEIPVPGLDKKEETNLTATDIIFGPDVELAGDSFLAAGKLGRRIKERLTGEDLTDIGDLVIYDSSLPHGVDLIDKGKKNDWINFKGRWTAVLASNKVQGSHVFRDAIDIQKGNI